MPTKKPAIGSLRVWWIPQIPGAPFHVYVKTLAEARLTMNTLAEYDQFQFQHRIKPDYSNAGGVEVYEPISGDDDGWMEFRTEDDDEIDALDAFQIATLDTRRMNGETVHG